MTNIQVRTAAESDAAMLAGFRYQLRSSFRQAIENQEQFIERCTLWMRVRLRSQSSWMCWIAEWKQKPVGNLWAQLIEKIPNPVSEAEHFVYLTDFFVREEYRRMGIGSVLLSAALEWSKAKNAKTVILWPTERSRPLYLRQGFSEAGDLMHLVIKSE
jgi:GNAT superfamily N-acetyltransferase